jgi:hypothetical protein
MMILTVVSLLLTASRSSAQIIEAGLKGGLNLTTVKYDDADFRRKVKTYPVLGYSGGFVLSFKVKDKYFLHTEYLYTTKGRLNKTFTDPQNGLFDDKFKDKVAYRYFEVPMLFNAFFRGHLKLHGDKKFKYYAGAGPILSYWLGGRGKLWGDEFDENNRPTPLKYKIKFGPRGDPDTSPQDPSEVHVAAPNRLQLGFALGGGILTEPDSKQRILFDVRVEIGNSWLAKSSKEDYIVPTFLFGNNQTASSLQARNMGIRLSAIYAIELNTNKKVRNKGKSDIKKNFKKRR